MATGDDDNDVDGDGATSNEVDDDGDGATGDYNDDDDYDGNNDDDGDGNSAMGSGATGYYDPTYFSELKRKIMIQCVWFTETLST